MSSRARRPDHCAEPEVVARRAAWLWPIMAWWFERFVRQNLHALRLAQWGEAPAAAGRPLVIYSNHPAWWDGALYFVLAARLFPDRQSFVPVDAATLERYRMFERLGAFGVDASSPRGAKAFLRTAAGILARPDRALWITAQGRFADVRERPLSLRPGVAHLAEVAPDALFVPLALEYAFWTERGAEALAAFGTPRAGSELAALTRPARLGLLTGELEQVMDRLADDVIARDPARFRPLVLGRGGVGGIYDLGRRVRAAASGRRFDPAHRSEPA